ncbi:MAG: hypothetical protein HGA96_02340 [Desulfobulbaceae bacterium]|nr:hypothetical protein [Desulfobulbaceae bacterium]
MRKVGRLIPLLMVAGGILLSLSVAEADQITKPHTFSAGTPAKADQVNADFDTLYGQVNKVGAAITVDGANNVGIGIAAPAARLDVVSQPIDLYSPWNGYNAGANPCLHCLDTCNGDAVAEFTCPDGQSRQCEDLRNSAGTGSEYRVVQCDKIQPAASFTGDVNLSGGKLTTEALVLPLGATNGAVLTSDGAGNAAWRAMPATSYAEVAATVVANGITSINIAAGSITPDKLADTCVAGEVLVKTATGWVCGRVSTSMCSPGDFVSCYHSPATTMNVGACKAGSRSCLESGAGYGACLGEVLPTTEVCDGVDNDCDGAVDNGPDAPGWYADNDGDGFGNGAGAVQHACLKPTGMVSNNHDCNDNLSSVFPVTAMNPITLVGGVEICGDGVDNNCDGQTDNGGCAAAACTAAEIAVHNLCLAQCGDLSNPTCFMECLNGQVSGQCDNAILSTASCLVLNGCFVGPDLDAQCARNCRVQWETAFGPLPAMCSNGATRPCGSNVGECRQGTETCAGGAWSGVCSGGVTPVAEICGDGLDNDCNGAIDDAKDWYEDADRDGYGNSASLIPACAQPTGFVDNPDDCDDGNPVVNPGAAEICDGLDNNCDGQIDTNVPGGQVWWFDEDGDGFGGSRQSTSGCSQPPAGYGDGGDCDDSMPEVFPGAPEICNGLDDNCDGQVDEGCFGDSDGDNVPDYLDCAPFDATVFPGAAEVCGDGIDNNCNAQVDEGCGPDSDGDGHPDAVDCAPLDPAINPGASEVCGDGIDNNCNIEVDEGCSGDSDGDGYPDPIDCAPVDPTINPGAVEICGDGIDNNCNGQLDEGCGGDSDGDGYPDAVDCAPFDPAINPGAMEICGDGIDNNCNGQLDEGCVVDSDGDGYPDPIDCAPFDPAINPGTGEICGDGIDNNCDGQVDEGCGP